MLRRLERVAIGFSSDQYSEINERIENLENHNGQLADYLEDLNARIQRSEENLRSLANSVGTLTDSNLEIRERFETFKQITSEQQGSIDSLIKDLSKLKITDKS